jgi:hypothetical protein
MSTVQENVKNVDTWLRGLFIVIFGIIFYALVTIIWLLVIFQFVTAVVSGSPNANLKDFSESLSKYAYQVLRYMTFGTEERPWPFSPWPGSATGGTS